MNGDSDECTWNSPADTFLFAAVSHLSGDCSSVITCTIGHHEQNYVMKQKCAGYNCPPRSTRFLMLLPLLALSVAQSTLEATYYVASSIMYIQQPKKRSQAVGLASGGYSF